MKELSLNILDITGNSTKAGAKNISISITESGNRLELEIKDDGCGMDEETVKRVTDPFCTSRTTRKVGLGIPFLKLAAEQTGGHISIKSIPESKDKINHGTDVYAVFYTDHIDFIPLGDIVSTVTTLIQGAPNTDFIYTHKTDDKTVSLDTRQLREILGDVSLAEPEVIEWIAGYLKEQYES